MILCSFLVFLIISNFASPAIILCIFPVPYYSHQIVFQALTEELSKEHELVILTPQPIKNPSENITQIDVQNLSFTMWDEGIKNKMKTNEVVTMDTLTFLTTALKVMIPTIDAQFSVKKMQELIHDEKQHFDLILTEECQASALMIGGRFKAPVVLVSSFYSSHYSFEMVGAETNIIYYPYFTKMSASIWERLSIFIEELRLKMFFVTVRIEESSMSRKHFGDDALTAEEMRKNVKMMFLNINHAWDNNRPVTPSVVHMGAIHLKEPKALPADLQKYLDSSKRGVVYMSLGSKINSSDLSQDILRVIVKVFASLPYDVLWKWNGEDLPNKPTNVRLEKWLPQNDLLQHPAIKVFIMQGGLQSIDEAVAAGIPLIGLPVYTDQFPNVQKIQQYGIGLELDINNLIEEEFRRAILDIAENVRYRENVKRLSITMSDQRTTGLQRAVHWIQYIMRHGPPPLSPLANISNIEYYMLDVIIPFVLVFMLITVLFIKTLRYAVKIAFFSERSVTKVKCSE